MRSDAEALWRLTAVELGETYRSGAVDPITVTDACIERLEVVNPALNAVVTVDRDGARNAARASSERWRRGGALGALDGVPVTVKDNLFVGGLRATWGSLLFADHVAPQDDLSVAKLRSAGVVILGKTNTPELALAGHTDNRLFGPTGNPWDPALSPGGSSGGAAAALMSGIGPLALATDAGGSIRRPASYVGCVGLKPSVGRVRRRYGFPVLTADLQSIGPMARTVQDARLLFHCLAEPSSSMRDPAKRLKIGAFCRIGDAPVDPDVEHVWGEARGILETLGHEICEIPPPCDPDEAGELLLQLAAVGVARVVRAFPNWEAKVTAPIAELARRGLEIPATAYVELIERVTAFRWRVGEAFAAVDLFLTPSSALLPWPKTEPFPKMIAGTEAAPRAGAIYTTFGNVAGLAAISIPGGRSAVGHPIGVQLAGPSGSEELILGVAERFEEARPWPKLAMA